MTADGGRGGARPGARPRSFGALLRVTPEDGFSGAHATTVNERLGARPVLDCRTNRAMLFRSRPTGPRSPVALVLVRGAAGAADVPLSKFLLRLARAGVEDPPVVIVDPRRTVGEAFEMTDRLAHLGAPAAGGFVAAVAAAARWLAEQHAPALVLAADASAAKLEDELFGLVDEYALETARRGPAALALLDVPPGAPPRGGMLLLPASVAVGLADVSDLPAVSATELGTLLESAGLSLIDLRVIRRLRDNAVEPGALPREALARIAGAVALEPATERHVEAQFWIDEAYVSETVRHGERAPVVVRGWVVATPMPRRVLVRVDGQEALRADVSVRRPDVLASHPALEHEACGFELRGEVGPLSLGTHELEWIADGTGMRRGLGTLRVLPVHRVEVDRLLVPERRSVGESLPIVVEAVVVASDAVVTAEVRIADRIVPVRRLRARPRAGAGYPLVFDLLAAARLEGLVGNEDGELELEIRTLDPNGGGDLWSRRLVARTVADALAPTILDRRQIGSFDARAGGAPVELRGVVFGARAGDRVELLSGGRRLAAVAVSALESGDPAVGATNFALESAVVAGLTPGEHQFELALVRDSDSTRRTIERWLQTVVARAVTMRANDPRVSPVGGGSSRMRLVLEGEVEPAELVDSLALAVDDVVRTRLGREWLLPAEPGAGPAARWHRFRLDAEMAIAPGRRRLEIRVRRGGEESAVWNGEILVPEPGGAADARLRSPALDRLLAEDPAPIWSRLVIDGTLVGEVEAARVVLRLDGELAADSAVDSTGEFRLEVRPAPGGVRRGQVEVESAGTVVERSPEFRIAVRPLRLPKEAIGAFDGLLRRLLPAGPGVLGAAPEEILRRLFERDPGASGELLAALTGLERRAVEALLRPAEIVEVPPRLPDRKLSVLLACWEVPCSRHGGGVTMVNLLRHLGSRHDVTLVHTVAPGEEGLSEEVRPFVREILPVRREWRETLEDHEFGVPPEFARNWSPRVRRIVEAEVASGRYDLVNYEFNPMALHTSAWPLPAVGVLHEVHSFARHRALPARFETAERAAEWLEGVVAALHFETSIAPTRCGELATLTRPEAEFLARWLPGRRLYVSPIPIDVARFSGAPPPAGSGPPRFVFVGNYIHPPNRDAARILASDIAPSLLGLRGDCRFVVAGPHAPDDLRSLARPPAIEVAGFVPDLDGLLRSARAFLAPIVSGGGLRVKLLEAMASGCAVVSTALGFNGIPVLAGRDALVAESPGEFVAAALRLAEDEALARRIGAAGRALVERDFGIATQGERRERIWRAVLDTSR